MAGGEIERGKAAYARTRVLRAGIRMLTVSRTGGQHLVTLKLFLKNKHQTDEALCAGSANLTSPIN